MLDTAKDMSNNNEVKRLVTVYQCKRCDHEWQPRGGKPPLQCPRCKSYMWNVARTPKGK